MQTRRGQLIQIPHHAPTRYACHLMQITHASKDHVAGIPLVLAPAWPTVRIPTSLCPAPLPISFRSTDPDLGARTRMLNRLTYGPINRKPSRMERRMSITHQAIADDMRTAAELLEQMEILVTDHMSENVRRRALDCVQTAERKFLRLMHEAAVEEAQQLRKEAAKASAA
jgi:hypothetical protein